MPGFSGCLALMRPTPLDSRTAAGQHVLERSAVLLLPDGTLEARFTVGLPAQGRSIMGQWAAQILAQNLPGWVPLPCGPRPRGGMQHARRE